jgi:hypothetical protein
MNELGAPNFVRAKETSKCVDGDNRLESREHAPSNDPGGMLKFAESLSVNQFYIHRYMGFQPDRMRSG